MRYLSLAVFCLSLVTLSPPSRQNHIPPSSPGSSDSGLEPVLTHSTDPDPQLTRAQAYQQKLLLQERRKRMLAYAEQLALLSEALKTEVQAMSPEGISADVAGKAARAEQIARQLAKLNRQ